MTDNRRQILDMLAQGKINVEEAERLLSLLDQSPNNGPRESQPEAVRGAAPKYLRVVVEPEGESGKERVNIKVPIALIQAGVKLAALIPSEATKRVNEKLQQKGIGIDVGNLKADDLEQMINAFADMRVDVQDGKQQVRIFAE